LADPRTPSAGRDLLEGHSSLESWRG